MDFRMDTYIGNETVFTGHYEQCVEWIKEAVNAYLDERW